MFISFPNMQLLKPWVLMSNCDSRLSAYKFMSYILILGIIWLALMKKKKTFCTFGLLKDIIMKYEGEKHMEERNCTLGAGEGIVANCNEKLEELPTLIG